MSSLELTGLTGDNPLGMLAALGILDVLERRSHGTVRLRWTEELVPMPSSAAPTTSRTCSSRSIRTACAG